MAGPREQREAARSDLCVARPRRLAVSVRVAVSGPRQAASPSTVVGPSPQAW